MWWKLGIWTRESRGQMAEIAPTTKRYRMSAQLTGPTVYWWFRRFVRLLLFRTIHDVALMLDRERSGREASPSGGILGSQSAKAPHGATRGYDAGKKVLDRKRHIAVDIEGRLLMVNLTSADISDRAGARTILAAIRKRWPWLKHLLPTGPMTEAG